MARRVDDTEDPARPPPSRAPSRGRGGRVRGRAAGPRPERHAQLIISVAAVAVSLYALFWVVRPQPAQPYRTSFLAITMAMTLLAYRP